MRAGRAHRGPIQLQRVPGPGRCGAGRRLACEQSRRVQQKSQSAPCCWEQLWPGAGGKEEAAGRAAATRHEGTGHPCRPQTHLGRCTESQRQMGENEACRGTGDQGVARTRAPARQLAPGVQEPTGRVVGRLETETVLARDGD